MTLFALLLSTYGGGNYVVRVRPSITCIERTSDLGSSLRLIPPKKKGSELAVFSEDVDDT